MFFVLVAFSAWLLAGLAWLVLFLWGEFTGYVRYDEGYERYKQVVPPQALEEVVPKAEKPVEPQIPKAA